MESQREKSKGRLELTSVKSEEYTMIMKCQSYMLQLKK